jgi:uncharacterized membrane protein YphA (DoxX/SURF4 family)
MKLFLWISRIITGMVFIFSGTVKAIDPLGSAYKFEDYFQAFHIDFLSFLSLPMSFLLFTTEFLAGFSVLTGIRYRQGTWAVLLLMTIFTPLTFILALTNPVSDCGCFGDAVHLTNWQTFWKNVVLFSLAIFLFRNRKAVAEIVKPGAGWLTISSASAIFILFGIYNLVFLPVIDFLPYKKGTNIKEGMMIPPDMPADEYHTTFIYEKDGLKKEFTLENYPADDTTWKFVDQKSKLVKKGYQPAIHDFTMMTENQQDITDQVLSDPGWSILMIAREPSKMNRRHLEKGIETGRYLEGKPVSFYLLTSEAADKIKKSVTGLKVCYLDETTLKTMIRSDPGYILLKNGTIQGKWSWANVPGKEELASLQNANSRY